VKGRDAHVICQIQTLLRGGLVVKAHRLVYHSTLGLRVIKKEKKTLLHVEQHRLIGLGFRVYVLGFGVHGLGLRGQGSQFRFEGLGFAV